MNFKRKRRYKYKKTSTNKQCSKPESGTSSIPVKKYNSTVNLFASRCRLRKTGRTMAKISKYHILESKNTGREICHRILNTNIGHNEYHNNVNFDAVILSLSPILESFKNRHNRYNYFEELTFIIARDNEKYKKKNKNQIHQRSLQSFFSLLLHKNVPLSLFGTRKNFKFIKRTIGRLLKTNPEKKTITRAFKRTVPEDTEKKATYASLNMQPLFNKFDISRIKWFHSINNNTVKWIIILKLLHWFFAQYIIKILHKYVVLHSVKKQWIYFVKDDWCKMQEEFIKEKISTGGLVPWIPRAKKVETRKSTFNIPIGTYKFIPSSSGLRALLVAKYSVKEKFDDIDVVLRFLQQLYVTYFNLNGLPTIANCKQAIYTFKKASTKNPLYYVCCDIQDAFGSIIQKKLYKIITTCCRQLQIYLVLRTYSIPRNGKLKQTVQFLPFYLRRAIGKKAIMNKKRKLVKLTKLVRKINKLIFDQKVKLDGKVYSIKHGVPQGMRVSPILSDIYYQNMFKEMFSVYANNGLMCTYADDILYITENEHYATEFLEIIKNGIPEYNVKFNPNKIKTNVGLPYTPTKIKFLGCNIEL
ncbi:telomerase reverse transcriptase-like [Nylanderia fulva]|uniref:telomerase reverse transcriptase-like n=1 Tax=Nylanderia fulva TaxID=613905 RepID=UPI0010FB338E|nr:telomerase reverse transcriptase-like [Nylanderia fulva]